MNNDNVPKPISKPIKNPVTAAQVVYGTHQAKCYNKNWISNCYLRKREHFSSMAATYTATNCNN